MLKYCIKSLAISMGRTDLGKWIMKLCDVSRATAYQYLNLKREDARSIPSDHLKKIADDLGVSMNKLYSNPINMTTDEEA